MELHELIMALKWVDAPLSSLIFSQFRLPSTEIVVTVTTNMTWICIARTKRVLKHVSSVPVGHLGQQDLLVKWKNIQNWSRIIPLTSKMTFMLTQKASSLTCVKVSNNKRVLIQGASLRRWSLHLKRKRNQFGNWLIHIERKKPIWKMVDPFQEKKHQFGKWLIHFKRKKPVWKLVDPIHEKKKPVLKLLDPFQENKLFLIKNVT